MAEPVPVALRLLPPGIDDARSRRLAALLGRLDRLDLAALRVTDPWRVDASALPALLWQWGLDDWLTGEVPEIIQRRLLAQAALLWKRLGTVWAVEQAIGAAGVQAEVVEWWQEQPAGAPGTFTVTAWVADNLAGDAPVLTPERYLLLARLIDRAKPKSRHFAMRVGAAAAAGLAFGGGVAAVQCSSATVTAAAREAAAAGLAFGGGVAAVQVTDAVLRAA